MNFHKHIYPRLDIIKWFAGTHKFNAARHQH